MTAARGQPLTVHGVALGANQGGSTLLLDGKPVAIDDWSDTSITFTVPEGLPAGEVSLQVAVYGYVSAPVTLAVT